MNTHDTHQHDDTTKHDEHHASSEGNHHSQSKNSNAAATLLDGVKKVNKHNQMLLPGIGVLLLLAGLVTTMSGTQTSTDVRSSAAGETATLTLVPGSQAVTANQPFTIELQVDSDSTPIDGVQARIGISGNATVTADDPTISGLTTAVLDVTNTEITLLAITSSPSIPYVPSSGDTVLEITITPQETVTLTFDNAFSKITATGDPTDILLTPSPATYTISGAGTGTPNPSPTVPPNYEVPNPPSWWNLIPKPLRDFLELLYLWVFFFQRPTPMQHLLEGLPTPTPTP